MYKIIRQGNQLKTTTAECTVLKVSKADLDNIVSPTETNEMYWTKCCLNDFYQTKKIKIFGLISESFW